MNQHRPIGEIRPFPAIAVSVLAILIGGCGKGNDGRGDLVAVETSAGQAIASRESARLGKTNIEPTDEEKLVILDKLRPSVTAFCGDCHAMPRPTSSPKAEWVAEVDQGYTLYRTSGRTDLDVPDRADVLKFFQWQAPDTLPTPPSTLGYLDTPVKLLPQSIGGSDKWAPGVTNVRWLDFGWQDEQASGERASGERASGPALVYSDVSTGQIKATWLGEASKQPRRTMTLATLLQPVHIEMCDLDNDGLKDLVVADIGEFNANDSDLGRVVWLRQVAPEGDGSKSAARFESIVLADGLSRVSDARPGDFDGDGDQDVLVAVFGWRNSGETLMLENTGGQTAASFKRHLIDDRHGPVHVPPADINGDGRLDFVALISQEHERVEAFINLGEPGFAFRRELIYAAPDPAYGSSGIELVDMDGDSDLDILYSNGDSFDRGPKPHHSIQWLENVSSDDQPGYPYVHHHLANMPGVLNARAGDFDGDGDMDVVAASLLADPVVRELEPLDTSSVVMLLQEQPGRFTPRKVEGKSHFHLSIETGDFDNDGATDFAIGNFMRQGDPKEPDVIVWWNRN